MPLVDPDRRLAVPRSIRSSGESRPENEGERVFDLVPTRTGTVEFSMREQFTGLLAPLIGRTLPTCSPRATSSRQR
jgi:hypothetical protein